MNIVERGMGGWQTEEVGKGQAGNWQENMGGLALLKTALDL